MELAEVIGSRRMVRAFRADPVDPTTVDRLVAYAERAPSAGNVGGRSYVVLDRPEDVTRYWAAALPAGRRADFAWPELLVAPTLVLPCCEPGAYVRRYAESDKVASGLGVGEDRWMVPYWFVDGGAAVMAILLGATDEGLGALFFGIFARTDEVKAEFSIPPEIIPLGVIALGHPAVDQRPGRSAGRKRPAAGEVIHRGGWAA